MTAPRKSSLSPARRQLVDAMSEMRFGRIRSFEIRDGEPTFEKSTRFLPEVRFDSGEVPPEKSSASDFELRRQIVALFEAFDRLRNAHVEFLEVRHGLPWRMQFEKP